MSLFIRLLLMGGLGIALLFSAVLVVAGFAASPTLGWLALAAGGGLFAINCRRRSGEGWLHGTAAWASWRDMLRAGYLGASRGTLIGHVKPPRVVEAAWFLLTAPMSQSDLACRMFVSSFRGSPLPVRLAGTTHEGVIARTGAGKSASVTIPHAKTDTGNNIFFDPKGEVYQNSARDRRQMGQKVVALDPFNVVGGTDGLNPLDLIDTSKKTWQDDIRALAEALQVRTGNESEPHWQDSAVTMHCGVMTYVALHEKKERNLSFVADLLAEPSALAKVQLVLKADKNPLVARLGGMMEAYTDRERQSVLTTANRALAFLGSEPVANAVSKTTFRLADIRKGMSVYVIIPLEYMSSHSGLLRLWLTTLMKAVMRGGLDERNPVTFVIDEAPALGKLDVVKNALVQMRGYGLRLKLILQNKQQLSEMFPGQEMTALGACDAQIHFGVADYDTAELVSKQLGQATRTKVDTSGGTSRSRSYDQQGGTSTSYSSNDNWSTSQMGRELFKPEEILQLEDRTAIVLTKRCKPILTTLPRYYEKGFAALADGTTGNRVSRAKAIAVCVIACLAPVLLWLEAQRQIAIKHRPTPPTGVVQPAGAEKRDDDRLRDGEGN